MFELVKSFGSGVPINLLSNGLIQKLDAFLDAFQDKEAVKVFLQTLQDWQIGFEQQHDIRKKPDRAGIYPKARICWKGYDFDILNELTDEGLVNAGVRSKSASFTDEGTAKALELLRKYGISLD